MTFSGFIIAGLFFCISASKPLKSLSPEKPPVNLFSWSILTTIALQFAGHFATMAKIRQMALPFVASYWSCGCVIPSGAEELLPDSDFKPNVLNTVIFLLDMAMQLIVFLVNYQGHPFMQSIRENKVLFYGLVGSCCFYLILAGEIIPPFNRYMELAPFPDRKVWLCRTDDS